MSSSSPNPSKAQRRDAARAQALALKKKQEAADKRARTITLSLLGVVLLALIAVVAWLFIRDHNNNAANAVDTNMPLSQVQNVPSTAGADGGITISDARAAGGTANSAVPTVGIYFDYMCPICGQFEQLNQDALEAFLKDGTANVVMFPVSILDRQSQGTQYSTRAGSAAAWVADKAPDKFLDFHEALFANEPKEQTAGHTDKEIADLARQAGVPDSVAAGIENGDARRTFGQWITSATLSATSNSGLNNPQSGGFGTPTITIDGKRWDGNWTVPGTLAQAVADATK